MSRLAFQKEISIIGILANKLWKAHLDTGFSLIVQAAMNENGSVAGANGVRPESLEE
jgi:hypothetical protein